MRQAFGNSSRMQNVSETHTIVLQGKHFLSTSASEESFVLRKCAYDRYTVPYAHSDKLSGSAASAVPSWSCAGEIRTNGV